MAWCFVYFSQRVLEKFQHKNPYGVNASMYIVQEIAGVSSALIIKLILLIFTFGLQVPCGIFVPSIVLGSLLGRIVGLGLEYFTLNYPYFYLFKTACSNVHRCVYPSLYAIVGGAAVLGGITHMTVCVVIMMIEITGKLNYILPLILSVMMAKWVSNALLKYGMLEIIYNNTDTRKFHLLIITRSYRINRKYVSLILLNIVFRRFFLQ
ncbi:hypothetical protein HZS_1479 [Henneguya salminicola]|nr:hypothetical protein HZS_1479 [Henneguya salminicola]